MSRSLVKEYLVDLDMTRTRLIVLSSLAVD